jgi:hypothetical protein
MHTSNVTFSHLQRLSENLYIQQDTCRGVNQHSFSAFREVAQWRPLMDNASIHKTRLVREACGRNNIRPVYTRRIVRGSTLLSLRSPSKGGFRKLHTRTEAIPEFHLTSYAHWSKSHLTNVPLLRPL